MIALALSLFLVSGEPTRVLTLEEAVAAARARHPGVLRETALDDAARARGYQALSPMLPQLVGSARYERATANTTSATSFASADFFNFSLTLSQSLFDFGVLSRYLAARALTDAQHKTLATTIADTVTQARVAYYTAAAALALVDATREAETNQERHLKKIAGLVSVGSRPAIDLAQGRTDRANAEVQRLQAENAYAASKVALEVAIGAEPRGDFDIAPTQSVAVAGEDETLAALIDRALAARPEMARLDAELRAQIFAKRAAYGGYAPALGLATAFNENGPRLNGLVWNWNLIVTASWSFFQGGYTTALASEQSALVRSLEAQRDGLRQTLGADLQEALLAVRSQKAVIVAASEALVNARERLTLAEGRYTAGVGNVIELGDAQLAVTNAAVQKVRAELDLSIARARLQSALGAT